MIMMTRPVPKTTPDMETATAIAQEKEEVTVLAPEEDPRNGCGS